MKSPIPFANSFLKGFGPAGQVVDDQFRPGSERKLASVDVVFVIV